ncbi:hypothetical protein ACJJTC_007806 [Scirpophaga incertulas]
MVTAPAMRSENPASIRGDIEELETRWRRMGALAEFMRHLHPSLAYRLMRRELNLTPPPPSQHLSLCLNPRGEEITHATIGPTQYRVGLVHGSEARSAKENGEVSPTANTNTPRQIRHKKRGLLQDADTIGAAKGIFVGPLAPLDRREDNMHRRVFSR